MGLDCEKNKIYKVLLLDDEALVRTALKAFLKGTEFCLVAVSTAEEAEAALRHANFDIIVSDILMDPVDGFAFRDRVRRFDSGIPFIFLTSAAGGHDNSLFLRIMDDLFSYYLPKGAGANILLQKLRQVAQTFRTRQEARQQQAIIRRNHAIAATVQQALMPPWAYRGEGCEYAFMEVSSHSVAQHRIGGLTFAGGIFTNLTRDHLDYHKTFENYRDAKKAFFDALPREAFAVTNADDRNGMVMVQNTRAQVKTYSARGAADFRGRILEESFEGMNLEMDGREVFVQFVGRFNVSNLLAVYATAVLLGVEPDEALVQLSAMKPVNGRFESIRSPKGVTAIVDYAHTPDALVNVLQTINDVLQHRGECWTVCGAGGNRDRGKRPIMAKVAVENSDRVIITSDNPRFEDPQAIIDDMLAGLSEEQRQSVLNIVDRREAIRTACMLAKPGDVILVAGKGHEDYQIVQGVKHHFDDHEVIREAFGLSDK